MNPYVFRAYINDNKNIKATSYEFIAEDYIIGVEKLNEKFALKILKRLVAEDNFIIINRRAPHAKAVTNEVAKIVISQLTISDFVKRTEDKAFPGEFLWIYKTEVGIVYYIKCKFSSNLDFVKFISFHKALY